MTDERQPHFVAAYAWRRRIGMGARHPIRPGLPLTAATELPAQHFAERFRRRAIGIEEMRAVEMIGRRPGIGFHAVNPDGRQSRRGHKARESGKSRRRVRDNWGNHKLEVGNLGRIWLWVAIRRDRSWIFTTRGSI